MTKEDVAKRMREALDARPWIEEGVEQMRRYVALTKERLPNLEFSDVLQDEEDQMAYTVFEEVLSPHIYDVVVARVQSGPTLQQIVNFLDEVVQLDQDGEDLVVVGIFEGLFSRMVRESHLEALHVFRDALSPGLRRLADTTLERIRSAPRVADSES